MCASGFTEPGAIYRVDMAAEQPAPELFRQTKLKVPHNPTDYETHQVSLGGTTGKHSRGTLQGGLGWDKGWVISSLARSQQHRSHS